MIVNSLLKSFKSRSGKQGWIGFALFAPGLALMCLFLLYPVVLNIYTSFFSKHLIRPRNNFIGFKNYLRIFNDDNFVLILQNEITWTVFSVIFQVILGLGVALLLRLQILLRLLSTTYYHLQLHYLLLLTITTYYYFL